MLESILMTLNAKKQESGVYIADWMYSTFALEKVSAPSDPLTLHKA